MDNMDNLGERLAKLMEDPEEMEKLKAMAEGIMGQSSQPQSQPLSGLFGGISPDDLGAVMQLSRLLGSEAEDDRTHLLLALKPHLSAKRQDRIDKAVKLLRIASILPLIKDQGIL